MDGRLHGIWLDGLSYAWSALAFGTWRSRRDPTCERVKNRVDKAEACHYNATTGGNLSSIKRKTARTDDRGTRMDCSARSSRTVCGEARQFLERGDQRFIA